MTEFGFSDLQTSPQRFECCICGGEKLWLDKKGCICTICGERHPVCPKCWGISVDSQKLVVQKGRTVWIVCPIQFATKEPRKRHCSFSASSGAS